MNEMYLIANEVNADWGKAIEGFTLDNRVGSSHVNVPGHDGKYGFGGSCFPKDIQALIHFGDMKNIASNRLEDWLEEDEDVNQSLDFNQKSFYNENYTSNSLSDKREDDPWI